MLQIESSSLCNLACPKCHHKSSQRSYGNMKTGLALDLITQATEMQIRVVSLSMLGEPLLHPELEEIIAFAHKKGMYVYFVTNATLLSPERSKSLIEAGIHSLGVSIDGWDKISYGQRHSGMELQKVIENLKAFREIREGSSNKPLIMSTTTIDTESIKHMPEIRKLLSPIVDACRLNFLTDFGFPAERIDPALLPGTKSWKRMPCLYLWHNLSVGWNGKVTACCNDHEFLLVYGDATEHSLEQIWDSEKIREFRLLHINRDFNKMPLCGRCTRDWINSIAFQKLALKFNCDIRQELS